MQVTKEHPQGGAGLAPMGRIKQETLGTSLRA